MLISTGLVLNLLFMGWWFSPVHVADNFSEPYKWMNFVLFGLLSYVVWYQIINEAFSWYVAGFMRRAAFVAPDSGMRVAFLTAFVPGSEPISMLENTLKAMKQAEYPHDTWVLDEGNNPQVIKLCKSLHVYHFSRKDMSEYNGTKGPFKAKTKGGNYNAWFDIFGKYYDFVAQLDVDFEPDKHYLNRTLGYFKDPKVAFVGTPQIYANTKDSWIARGAAEQAYNFYGSMQQGFFGMGMPLFIGANHVLRVEAHNQIEGYSGHIVEDHLTGMRLYAKQWKSVYVPEKLAYGEGPATWSAYFSQQMRWAYGLIDILFKHSPRVFYRMKGSHVFNYFLLQQYYFYGLAQVIGILLMGMYFIFGIEITPMPVVELLVLYLPILIFQQIFFLWLQRFNVDPETEKGFMLRGKLLNWAAWPIYFMAFLGVLFNKRLTYVVTPKGSALSTQASSVMLFLPHMILGMLTLVYVIVGVHLGRTAPLLMFWGILNTLIMFGFVVVESIPIFTRAVKRLTWPILQPVFSLPRYLQLFRSDSV